MTGHLVFSTLHTNSALGTLSRLLDIGIDNFLISSSLIGVVGQRLVRELCPYCKEGIKIKGHDMKEFELEAEKEYFIYRAVGRKKCKNIGYTGRTVVAEMLNVDDKIRELTNKNESTLEIKKY